AFAGNAVRQDAVEGADPIRRHQQQTALKPVNIADFPPPDRQILEVGRKHRLRSQKNVTTGGFRHSDALLPGRASGVAGRAEILSISPKNSQNPGCFPARPSLFCSALWKRPRGRQRVAPAPDGVNFRGDAMSDVMSKSALIRHLAEKNELTRAQVM